MASEWVITENQRREARPATMKTESAACQELPDVATQRLLGDLDGLSPACFGIVMATGIISITAHLLVLPLVAGILFWINIAIYVALWLATVLRLVIYPRHFFGDMVDHLRGPGFFTVVAGTNVLGSQFVILYGSDQVALILWGVAIVLWLALTYTIFTAFTVKKNKPTLDQGISGGWLLAVVATQSIAVLGTLLAVHLDQPYKLGINFFALSMWLWGGMLYIWMMSLIFFRYTFFRFSPADLSPPYWINMGAMAISTLAGALLILNVAHAPFLDSLLPFLKGFSVFYWATGTWWIPMLLILVVWRHVYKRFPLKYDPLYWGAVFPLGMYAAGTHEMARAMGFHFLDFVPPIFFTLALAAWALAFTGFVVDLLPRIAASRRALSAWRKRRRGE